MTELIRLIGVLSMVFLTWKIMFFAKEHLFNSYEVLLRDTYFEREFYGEISETTTGKARNKTSRHQRTQTPMRQPAQRVLRQRPAAIANASRYTSYSSYEDFRRRNKNLRR